MLFRSEIVTTYDRSQLIDRAIDNLSSKLLEEFFVVAIVCALFLWHVRSALVAIISLPLGLCIAFIVMHFQGLNANIMSLGGIAIAVGAMVDAAIVMIENAHKRLEEWDHQHPGEQIDNATRWKVITDASVEVGPALFISLLIITLSFIPIFTLEGQEGRLFGLMLTLCSSVMGVLAGALQGYYGGKVDLWGQRFIEVWSGMPTLFLIILLSSVVQPNFWWLLAITVLFGWMSLVGVVRAEFLRTRNFDYIRAAQALGVSDRSIILRHMLPNAMVATLTFLPFILCSSITTLTSLDFLGFGLPLGSPSLGELLLQGKNNLQAPWLGITAFLSVAILLSLLIFIGEAVRDAFDPNKAV